jgi:hypothetical protein
MRAGSVEICESARPGKAAFGLKVAVGRDQAPVVRLATPGCGDPTENARFRARRQSAPALTLEGLSIIVRPNLGSGIGRLPSRGNKD